LADDASATLIARNRAPYGKLRIRWRFDCHQCCAATDAAEAGQIFQAVRD
jgi:hypothetical protein